MSLDVWLHAVRRTQVYEANITHNLATMAHEAKLYEPLWRPIESGYTTAYSLIEPLRMGLQELKSDPARFRAYDSPNGWGKYDHLVLFTEQYLEACIANPDATVSASV